MNSLEPCVEDRKKFDLDLEYGKVRFHNLCVGDETFCTLVFNTNSLKKIIDNLDSKRSVSGGDHNASRMYLVNLQKLFSSDVIKAFKDNKDVEN